MKSWQLSSILLILLNTIVAVNESNKGLQTEMQFSDFFLSRRWRGGTICKRRQGSTRQTEIQRTRLSRSLEPANIKGK